MDVGGGGSTGQGMTVGRCIWILATSRAMVHDNWVRNCSSHALDFDAYTSASAAYGNLCEDNREEGIFVEETASGNFVFNNTLRRNGCGIGVYSMAVGYNDCRHHVACCPSIRFYQRRLHSTPHRVVYTRCSVDGWC